MNVSPVRRRTPALQKQADALKAASFRPVVDGYIYRAPNPWIFGRSNHYLVDEGQQEAIIDILVPQSTEKTPISRMTRLMLASLFGLLGSVPITSLLLLFSIQYPAFIWAAGAATVALLCLLAMTLLTLHRLAVMQLANLRPILGAATPSKERITNDDVLWAVRTGSDRISTRRGWMIGGALYAIVSAAFIAFAFVRWNPGEGFFAYLQSFFMVSAACLFGCQSAFNVYCAQSDRLPGGTRAIERIFKRTLLLGTGLFVAMALGYAGLLAAGVIPPDFVAARARFERSALAGDAEAMTRLAGQYRDGRGGPQDYVKAREWFEKAAATGDEKAMFWLGWLQQKGLGGAQDYISARVWFEKAAAKGDGAAMSWLGANAQYGVGITKDYAQALVWYEKAAATGNSSGMNGLASIYRDGLGVPQDYTKARAWNEKAAAAGSAASMNELGRTYVNGWGVPRDLAVARSWYEKAAAAGQLDSMQYLAILLDKGDSGPADPSRAAHLLLTSARLGHPWSKTVLGGPLLILAPATRSEIKRELTKLGQFHGTIDDVWNDESRTAVAAYLKVTN